MTACACGAPAPPALHAERVVLVTIDTLRADHVGCYGAEDAVTPALDALAAAGVRFDVAISPAPLTLPSHTTLMTGMDPTQHGVRHNSIFRLDDQIVTLAETLRAAGFATAAFVGAYVLHGRFGLAQGFDVYDDELGYRRSAPSQFAFVERPADEVVDAALAWLAEAPERFLLWVHLYDPHAAYRPPLGFALAVPGNSYAGEIAFADAQVGRLLDGIRERWPAEGTLVVVSSDHGEGLGEHDEQTHSHFVYDTTQRVPLIMSGAGLPAGRVVPQTVRLADVAPTLVAAAEAEPIPGASGSDLLPLIRGEEREGRIAYVETLATQLDLDLSPLLGLRTDRFKFIRAPRRELYDVVEDPGELRDLAASRSEVADGLDALLEERTRGGTALAPSELPGREERARLEALGYVVPDSLDALEELGKVGGRDPKDFAGLTEAINRAGDMISTGRAREALALLAPYAGTGVRVAQFRADAALDAAEFAIAERAAREVVAGGSQVAGRVLLGRALLAQGRAGEARAEYQAARAADPEAVAPLVALADLAAAEGRRDEARQLYARAMAVDQSWAKVRWGAAALHIEEGDPEAAEVLLGPVPEDELMTPVPAIRLAQAERVGGRLDAALARLERSVRIYDRAPRLLWEYASALEQAGRRGEVLRTLERLVSLEPENPVFLNNLAWLLVREGGDLDRALALAERAIDRMGRAAPLLDTLAIVRLARGEAREVLALVEEALPGAPELLRPHLRYLEAEAHAALGDRTRARRRLEQALAGEPDASSDWMGSARALERRLRDP